MVIQLMRPGPRANEPQLSSVAQAVARQKGWEFRAIYINAAQDKVPVIVAPTPGQLSSALDEIHSLVKAEHRTAAFVTAWATLESLARLATANGETEQSRCLSPIQAVQALAEQGYLENDAADQLRKLAKLRDAIVHGDLSAVVPEERIEFMLQELRRLTVDVVRVRAALQPPVS